MSRSERVSPRQEALNAILETRGITDNTLITAQAWERLVALAWENRTHAGDRREIRREVRRILLEDGHGEAVA